MRIVTGTLLSCALLLTACSDHTITGPSPDTLATAPTSLVIDGTTLELGTYLWRDFEPTVPPDTDGQPLMAALLIQTQYASPVPDGVSADSAWVLYDGHVWAAPVQQDFPAMQFNVLEVEARDGPKWGPGVTVDVVVRVRYQNESFLLRAPNQTIYRTG